MSIIKEYQANNGLNPDGIIGKQTTATMRQKWGLTSSQLAHFLGQCHIETGGFKYKEENLLYSAQRLRQIFPKYFTPELAQRYAYNTAMIANIAYSNRMGNGDICTEDGYRFRGRGCLQLTGAENYRTISRLMSIPELLIKPDIVTERLYWESGLVYFAFRGIWELSKEVNGHTIRQVTIKVNGGTTALKERDKWTRHYLKIQG